MNVRNNLALFALLLMPAAAFAQEAPPASPPPTPAEIVLGLIPADAGVAAFSADLNATLENPMLKAVAEAEPDLRTIFASIGKLVDGPVMLSVSGPPILPPMWRVTLAAHVAADAGDPMAFVEQGLAPLLNAGFGSKGVSVSFARQGDRGQLTCAGPVTMTITLAARDGIVFGSSDATVVDTWVAGEEAAEGFVDGAEFAKLSAGKTIDLRTLVYVNLRTIMPMAGLELNQAAPRLYEALQLDRLESVALLTGSEKTPPPPVDPRSKDASKGGAKDAARPAPKPAEIVRLSVGARHDSPGVLRFIASAPGKSTLARYFPPDTLFVVSGSTARGSDFLEDLYAFFGTIDRVIVDEYQQEREEFKKDIGIDLQSELAANLGGEWAVGGRPDHLLVAIRIANVELFKTHLHRLKDAFKMEAAATAYRGEVIFTADRKPRAFSYAIVSDALLLAGEPQVIAHAVDAVLDNKSLATTKRYQSVRKNSPAATSKFIYADASALASGAFHETESLDMPGLHDLAKAQIGAGLSVTPHDGMIAFDLIADGEAMRSATAFLSEAVAVSIQEGRRQAVRAVAMTNIKNILITCHLHANDNKGEWPENLGVIAAAARVGTEEAAKLVMSGPYGSGGAGAYYIYRRPQNPANNKSRAEEVVIGEPAIRDGGASFGYLDGHVEWVTSPKADELLARLKGR